MFNNIKIKYIEKDWNPASIYITLLYSFVEYLILIRQLEILLR